VQDEVRRVRTDGTTDRECTVQKLKEYYYQVQLLQGRRRRVSNTPLPFPQRITRHSSYGMYSDRVVARIHSLPPSDPMFLIEFDII
jgi:hypothetical protein